MYELIDKIIEVSKYTAEDRGDNDISDVVWIQLNNMVLL